MNEIEVKALPERYKIAVAKEHQGTLTEVSYRVRNYITPLRQLATNQSVSCEEAGRETVEANAITKQCMVYLPAGYAEHDTDTPYNVLYLLHGVGGNRHEWLEGNGEVDGKYIICNIFDHLVANGEIDPMIVVFPDGRSAHDWTDRSFNAAGTNMLGFYYFDYELRYDLMPFIESTYKTYANMKDISSEGIAYNRMHRAIAGLSMGGMQSLNLTFGGHRCDSTEYTGTNTGWKNGLDATVLTPGMEDLFAYVGAFSNAPTSSEGQTLGAHIAACGQRMELLYMTCGDTDGVRQLGYDRSIHGLEEAVGGQVSNYYEVLMNDGIHDFKVWNNGAYNFARLSFGKLENHASQNVTRMRLDLN